MQFYTADYVLGAVTIVAAAFGLFGGFSGALGFCAGVAAAGAAARLGYPFARAFFPAQWSASLAALGFSLLAFGLARMLVKRVVKGLLAQPADAVFGLLVAAVTGAGGTLAALYAAQRLMGMNVDSSVFSLVMGWFGC